MAALDEQATAWGLQTEFVDALGHERRSPDEAVETVLRSLRRGGPPDAPRPGLEVEVIQTGVQDLPAGIGPGVDLTLEDGSALGPVDALPADLPLGYHCLTQPDGTETMLVACPPTANLDPALRTWGWAVQLYACRSAASWGMGNLADARRIGEWAAGHGGTPVLQINPLHAANPGPSPQPSPYFASSRIFRNPMYLCVAQVPGAADADLGELARRGRALNEARLIDRAAVWSIQREALQRIFDLPGGGARVEAEAAMAVDPLLAEWAAFCAAVELHGEPWWTWPEGLRRPEGRRRDDGFGWPGFRLEHGDRIRFHAWLQVLVDRELGSLAAEVPLVHDLAIGTDRAGFDAWRWQEVFVLDGTRIGAPPDQFNTQGQDWGLPPWDPWRLRGARYEPFVRALRSGLQHGAGLRIDHVMGLFRLYWVPGEQGPADGVYVRMPHRELLDLVNLESVRAGTFVVGEDLGTVEPQVREELAARDLLSYRVLVLDEAAPAEFPTNALAAASTHDLATLGGFWSGADLEAQDALGLHPNVDDTLAARRRLAERTHLDGAADLAEVVARTYRLLSSSPCRVVVGQLEDPAGVQERPNMPGTIEEWPNWRQALPRPIDDLLGEPAMHTAAEALAEGRTG